MRPLSPWAPANSLLFLLLVVTHSFKPLHRHHHITPSLHHAHTQSQLISAVRFLFNQKYCRRVWDTSIRAQEENLFHLPEDKYQLLRTIGVDASDIALYEAALRQCAKDGDTQMAEAVLHQIRSNDLDITQQCFEYIVQAFLQHAAHVLSVDSADDSVHMHERYNENTLPSTAAAEVVADGKALFVEMLRSGFDPPRELLGALMIALGRTGQPEAAEEMFDRVTMASPFGAMGTDEYNSLMASYSFSDASREVSMMHRNDSISLSFPSFPQLDAEDDTMYKESNPEILSKVHEIYKRMLYIGLRPNVRTYELLFFCMLRNRWSSGTANSVWKLYQRMVDFYQLTPSAVIFEQVLASTAHDTTMSVSDAKVVANRILTDAGKLRNKGSSNASAKPLLTRNCYESVLFIYGRDAITSSEAMRTLQQIYNAMASTVGVNARRVYPMLIRIWSQYSLMKYNEAMKTADVDDGCKHLAASKMAAKQSLVLLQQMHNTSTVMQPSASGCYEMVSRSLGYNGFAALAEKNIIHFLSSVAAEPDNTAAATAAHVLHDVRIWQHILAAYYNSRLVIHQNWITSMRRKYSGAPMVSMVERGKKRIDENILSSVDRVLSRLLQVNEVMIEDATVQSILISLYCACGKPREALEKYNLLRGSAFNGNIAPSAYLSMIQSVLELPSIESTELPQTLFEEMCQLQLQQRVNSNASDAFPHIVAAYDLIIKSDVVIDGLHLYHLYLRVLAVGTFETFGDDILSAADVVKQSNLSSSDVGRYISSLTKHLQSPASNALQVLKDIRWKGLEADIHCYLYLLLVMEKEVTWRPHIIPNRALEIFQYVVAKGINASDEFYTIVMRIWTKSRRPDAPRVVESVFKTYIALQSKISNSTQLESNVLPKLEFFLLLLESWSRSRLPTAAMKAEEVYQMMSSTSSVLNEEVFAYVTRAWSNWASSPAYLKSLRGAASMKTNNWKFSPALRLRQKTRKDRISNMDRTNVHRRDIRTALPPNEVDRISNRTKSSVRSSSILQFDPIERTEYYYQQCLASGFQPLPSMYRSLLSVWCMNGSVTALSNAEELLKSICLRSDNPQQQLHPSAYSMLAASWQDEAVICAMRTLKWLVEAGAVRQQLYIPYNLLLAAYAQSSYHNDSSVYSAERIFRSTLPFQVSGDVPLSQSHNLFEDFEIDSHHMPKLDIISANLVIESIIQSDLKDGVAFKKCEDIYQLSKIYLDSPPSDYTFQLMLSLWSERGCHDIAERAFPLFRSLTQSQLRRKGMTITRRQSYVAFATVLCNLRQTQSVALDLIIEMIEQHVIPDEQLFALFIRETAKSGQADLCEAAFRKMLDVGYPPGKLSSRSLLTVLSSSERANSAERTESAAKLVLKHSLNPAAAESFIQPLLLQAWGRSSSPLAYQHAEHIFERMVLSGSGVKLTVKMCNIMMNVYSNAGLPDRAERVLSAMKSNYNLQPDIVSYNTVITAWGKQQQSVGDTPEQKAFQLLEQAKADGIRPNVITYTSLLSALRTTRGYMTRNGNSTNEAIPAVLRAEMLFEDMQQEGVEPDTAMWNKLISMWCTSKESSVVPDREWKAQQAFERMLASGCSPNVITFTSLLAMWAESTNQEGASEQIINIFQRMKAMRISSDVVSYSSLLSALARSENKEAPQRATEIFEEMIKSGITPDVVAWTILIDIWRMSNQKGKEYEAQQVFERMRASGCTASVVTYTGMLQMWTFSRLPDARRYLEQMISSVETEYVKLDGYGFKVMVTALLKLYGAKQAHLALDRAEQLLMRLVNFDMAPSAKAWAVLMAKDKSSYRHHRVLRLYSIMNLCGVKPTKAIYDDVLHALTRRPNARAYSVDQNHDTPLKIDSGAFTPKDRVRMAMNTLQQMIKSDVQPSTKNYNSALLCISRSNLPDSSNMSSEVFGWMHQQYLTEQSNSSTVVGDYFEASSKTSRSFGVGIRPDGMTAKTLLWSFINDGDIVGATAVEKLDQMIAIVVNAAVMYRSLHRERTKEKLNFIVDNTVLNGLMRLWSKNLNWEEAAARVETTMALMQPNFTRNHYQHHSVFLRSVEAAVACDVNESSSMHIVQRSMDYFSYRAYFESWIDICKTKASPSPASMLRSMLEQMKQYALFLITDKAMLETVRNEEFLKEVAGLVKELDAALLKSDAALDTMTTRKILQLCLERLTKHPYFSAAAITDAKERHERSMMESTLTSLTKLMKIF